MKKIFISFLLIIFLSFFSVAEFSLAEEALNITIETGAMIDDASVKTSALIGFSPIVDLQDAKFLFYGATMTGLRFYQEEDANFSLITGVGDDLVEMPLYFFPPGTYIMINTSEPNTCASLTLNECRLYDGFLTERSFSISGTGVTLFSPESSVAEEDLLTEITPDPKEITPDPAEIIPDPTEISSDLKDGEKVTSDIDGLIIPAIPVTPETPVATSSQTASDVEAKKSVLDTIIEKLLAVIGVKDPDKDKVAPEAEPIITPKEDTATSSPISDEIINTNDTIITASF